MYNTDPPPRCQGTETNLTTKKLGDAAPHSADKAASSIYN